MLKLTMIKSILQIGDPLLNTKTPPIKKIEDKKTKQIIKDLLDTVKKNADISAGLAAPQIGYKSRVCVCRRVDLEESENTKISDEELWEVLINPKIIKATIKKSLEWEACLSIGVGDDNLWGPVERSKKVTVEFTSPLGELKKLTATGLMSHIIQHEIDHLNGILFVSHVSNPENIWKLKELNEYIEKNESYPEIL